MLISSTDGYDEKEAQISSPDVPGLPPEPIKSIRRVLVCAPCQTADVEVGCDEGKHRLHQGPSKYHSNEEPGKWFRLAREFIVDSYNTIPQCRLSSGLLC